MNRRVCVSTAFNDPEDLECRVALFAGDSADFIFALLLFLSPCLNLPAPSPDAQDFRKLFPLEERRVNSRRRTLSNNFTSRPPEARKPAETLIPFLAWRFRPAGPRRRQVTDGSPKSRSAFHNPRVDRLRTNPRINDTAKQRALLASGATTANFPERGGDEQCGDFEVALPRKPDG